MLVAGFPPPNEHPVSPPEKDSALKSQLDPGGSACARVFDLRTRTLKKTGKRLFPRSLRVSARRLRFAVR